jgi:hypothetical protein
VEEVDPQIVLSITTDVLNNELPTSVRVEYLKALNLIAEIFKQV